MLLGLLGLVFLALKAANLTTFGTSKGYASARLIQRDPDLRPITNATEKQVHGMIQKSIAKSFSSKGMTYGKGDADQIVAYMVV